MTPNTNRQGTSFSEPTKLAVWAKGTIVPGYDSTRFRKDTCGAWMEYSQHGNRQHSRGWECDHIVAKANGGSDELANLQPLQWENNAHKADNMSWSCKRAA
jgi:hypothetical protein